MNPRRLAFIPLLVASLAQISAPPSHTIKESSKGVLVTSEALAPALAEFISPFSRWVTRYVETTVALSLEYRRQEKENRIDGHRAFIALNGLIVQKNSLSIELLAHFVQDSSPLVSSEWLEEFISRTDPNKMLEQFRTVHIAPFDALSHIPRRDPSATYDAKLIANAVSRSVFEREDVDPSRLAAIAVDLWLAEELAGVLKWDRLHSRTIRRQEFEETFYRLFPQDGGQISFLQYPEDIGRLALSVFETREKTTVELHNSLIAFFSNSDGSNRYVLDSATDFGRHLRYSINQAPGRLSRLAGGPDYVASFPTLNQLLQWYDKTDTQSSAYAPEIIMRLADLLTGDSRAFLDSTTFEGINKLAALKAFDENAKALHPAGDRRARYENSVYIDSIPKRKRHHFYDHMNSDRRRLQVDFQRYEWPILSHTGHYSPLERTDPFFSDMFIQQATLAACGEPVEPLDRLDEPSNDLQLIDFSRRLNNNHDLFMAGRVGSTPPETVWERLLATLANEESRATSNKPGTHRRVNTAG